MRIGGCVSLATILQNPPPLGCLHFLLMRFHDARAAAEVLIVTPVGAKRQHWNHEEYDE